MINRLRPIQPDSCQFGYKLAAPDGQYGLDVALPEQLDIDEARMSVWITFADGNRRDGVGDLLEVAGIDTSRHRANPIVMFDHGKQVTLPVALAEDPQTKTYTVLIDQVNRNAKANCFFYQGNGSVSLGDAQRERDHALFCEQLFDLIVHKFIRAGSIGYQIIRSYPLPPDPERGLVKGLHLQQVLMLELSAVVLPANSDTVRKALALPSCCGKPLSPWLIKSLQPYVDEKGPGRKGRHSLRSSLSGGTNRSTPTSLSSSTTHSASTSLSSQTNQSPSDQAESLYAQQGTASTEKLESDVKSLRLKYRQKGGEDMAEQKNEERVSNEHEARDIEQEEPYGAQSLRQMHADHKLLMEDYAHMHRLNDHPKVKRHLEKHLAHMDKAMSEWEKTWTEEYGELKPLEGAMDNKDMVDEADSAEEELPPPEEAAENERKEPEEHRPDKVKYLRKFYRTKAASCGLHEHCTPDVASDRKKKKSVCAKCGKESCSHMKTKRNEGIENGHAPGNEEHQHKPGSEFHGEEGEEGHHPHELEDHEMAIVGKAHHFAGELAKAQSLTPEHRMEAFHHHKALTDVSLEEADAKVEHNLGNHEVPPAEWEPGAGAHKKLPSSDISSDKAKKILKDDEVRGHKLTPKQRGLFGAAAGKGKKSHEDDVPPHDEGAPGSQEWEREEMEEGEHPRKMCKGASDWFHEVSTGTDWNDEHRANAAMWHKKLGGIYGAKGDMAESDAAVREMGTMKRLKDAFVSQNEQLASITKKLAAIGMV